MLIATSASPFTIKELMVEYSEAPLGIDVERPRFSWKMESQDEERGLFQAAYQIIVSDEQGNETWNSGKIGSGLSLNIKYGGAPLRAATRYTWTVSVWDRNDEMSAETSWFETGLMSTDHAYQGWSGAKWIGGGDEDMVLYAQYLPVFKLNFSVQLDERSKSTHAGFVYGANDERLMDQYKNLYHLENKRDQSYLAIELDIAPLDTGKNALLHIYRAGYHPDDQKDVPYRSYPVPSIQINKGNKYEKHTVYLGSTLGFTRVYIGGNGKENLVAEINLNPLGQGGDFIAFPVVGDIGFTVSKGQSASFSDVEVRNFRSPANVIFSERQDEQTYQGIFSGLSDHLIVKDFTNDVFVKHAAFQGFTSSSSIIGGPILKGPSPIYDIKGGESGAFVVADPSQNSMPMLRTTFSTGADLVKARLYVTARGIYEVYLNGNRVGEDYFNPGMTQYNKTHLYQTYDVTAYIQSGSNAMGAILGEGWWSGGATFVGENWNYFGDRQSLFAKLVITYADGKEDVIVTGPSTWQYFNNGPVVYGSFFQGEVYDASREHLVEGWFTPSYAASDWKQAVEIGVEGYVSEEGSANLPDFDDFHEVKLLGQSGNAVRKIKELTAQSVEEVRPGVFVYDMGQNMVGVPDISLSDMEPGREIVLRFAEVKYPDLPEYREHVNMIMLENIRAAMAQDCYLTKGGSETIQPRFTFHGYRYVEITGIEGPLPLEAVKGTVLSSIHKLASYYETSNSLVDQLWNNITWSSYGNFLSIPTDCPQRNERLGWSGDISVFARTATYLANIPQFLRRHMLAMRDIQGQDGRFPEVAPTGVGFGGVMWGSAGITVAWESYQQYGDKELLAEHYDAMRRYVEFLIQEINPATGVLKEDERESWFGLGDWLSPEDHHNEKTLLWESYLIFDLQLMSKIASVLGKKDDADEFNNLCAERKDFFNKTYVDKEIGKTVFRGKLVDTQTSYVLPLAFDIFNDENKARAVDNFLSTVTREKSENGTVYPPYSLMTGFIGTSWINTALSETGRADMAYRLLQQTSYPSWLYPVTQGATTIWERLNSYTHLDGFGGNNRMNSFNHYSFGAVGAWMYGYSLGIARDEDSPGFKHFVLKPEPDPTGKMTYAKGYYDSMYGRIASEWKVVNGEIHYLFEVPANTSALLYLPASSVKQVRESGEAVRKATGVEYIDWENDKVMLSLQSGKYSFRVMGK